MPPSRFLLLLLLLLQYPPAPPLLLVVSELFFRAGAREPARVFVRSNRPPACAQESTTPRQQLLADAAAVRSARGWTADPAELVAGTAGADIAEPLPAPAAQEVSEEKEGTDPS